MIRHALLRQIRKENKLTLVELSERTGYTASFLSQLERGLKQPSLDAIRKIADALSVSIVALLVDTSGDAESAPASAEAMHCYIGRNNNRKQFIVENDNTVFESLTPSTATESVAFCKDMYGALVHIAPGAYSNQHPLRHYFDECCYVIHGSMRAFIGADTYDLGMGDSIYVQGQVPHNYQNTGEDTLDLLLFQAK